MIIADFLHRFNISYVKICLKRMENEPMMSHSTAVLCGCSGSIRKTLITYDCSYRAHKKQASLLLRTDQKELFLLQLYLKISLYGKTLVEHIRAGERYGLIFLDIEMKHVDGISAARLIRETDRSVLFIYISGYDSYLKELHLFLVPLQTKHEKV